MASHPIYEFYAELDGFKPKIWRRFQVTNNVKMARLGYIVMTLFEMQASHLFSFEVPNEDNFKAYLRDKFPEETVENDFKSISYPEKIWRFEVPYEDAPAMEESDIPVFDATQYNISQVISYPNQKLLFNYDFGDSWQVLLTLEKEIIDRKLPGKELPKVLAGEGYGIIEDCGGVTGLEDLAKAFKKKTGNAYKEYREWLGVDDLDIKSFDIDDMNFRLKKVPRIYADIYEYDLEPTKHSLDILERRYKK